MQTKYKIALILTILGFILYGLYSKDKVVISQKIIEDKNISIAKEEVNSSTIPLKIKKSKPVAKQKITNDVNETNETNETTVPKLCVKSMSGILSDFSQIFHDFNQNGIQYELDNQGKVIATTIDINNDGKDDSKSLFTYDDNGNLINISTETYQEFKKFYDEDGTNYYTTEEFHDIPTEVSEVTKEYDDKNRLITDRFEENGFSRTTHYEYNDKGDVSREIDYENDEFIVDYMALNSYDKKGNLIYKKYKVIESVDINMKYSIKAYCSTGYKYNEFGKVEEKKVYMPTFKGSDKLKEIAKITYKYDKYGNLIEVKNSSGRIILQKKFGICGE